METALFDLIPDMTCPWSCRLWVARDRRRRKYSKYCWRECYDIQINSGFISRPTPSHVDEGRRANWKCIMKTLSTIIFGLAEAVLVAAALALLIGAAWVAL